MSLNSHECADFLIILVNVMPLEVTSMLCLFAVTCNAVAHICNVLTLDGTGRHHEVQFKSRMEVNPSAV
jgi:hypothetical protein